jgi:hypothetical protein
MPLSFPDLGTLHKLWRGQFCPHLAFSRLWPPKNAAAAKIGRPTICTELPASEKVCGITLKGAPLGDSAGANLIVDQVCGKMTRAARILSGTIIGCEAK